eukprot:12404661-Prorocentrum_lima.AAC.1
MHARLAPAIRVGGRNHLPPPPHTLIPPHLGLPLRPRPFPPDLCWRLARAGGGGALAQAHG